MRVTIDGTALEVEPGRSVLQALQLAGISLPALCWDERLAPAGVCRLCLVRIDGCARPIPACTTPVGDGMSIEARSPALEAQRHAILRLLAWSQPADAASRDAETPLVQALAAAGLLDQLGAAPDPVQADASHPYIRAEMARCIECLRCVRICAEVQGQFTWRVDGRGHSMRIVPDSWTSLRESSCVSCGACSDSCPTGALVDVTRLTRGAPDREVRTTCPYCGVGCELALQVKGDRIVQALPVLDAPVNRGHLCSKGRYAFDFVSSPDRVTTPRLRTTDGWRDVGWSEAVSRVAGELRRILDRHGAGAVGLLGSARATNEENYVAQKFARLVLGTNHVDCCARVCHAPSAAALSSMLGAGAATNSFDDLEEAKAILVFGSNTTACHPVVGARIKQASLRGVPLIVIDPRITELARYARIHLRPRPGTNVPLLHAMAQAIVAAGLEDADFLRDRVSAEDEYRRFVAAWSPEAVAPHVGIDATEIRRAALLYASARPAISFHGLGLTEQLQGTEGVECLVNLALLTGNVGRRGAGVNPLRGQNNVQGAAHMGCDPAHLAGYAPIATERARFEKAWHAPLPTARGLDLLEMVQAAEEGTLKALWAVGYDLLLTDPEFERTRAALRKLELLVVQDLFPTRTALDGGTVLLPSSSSFEKDGTFMNGERRVQLVRRAIPPLPGTRTDWEIFASVAAAMGKGEAFSWSGAEAIWDEIRAVWPGGAGLGWARLEGGGLQWPCPDESHPGTRVLHVNAFAGGGRADLRRVGALAPAETPDPDHPLVLVTGRSLYAFNAGTMTARTPHLELRPADLLDVSPADALRLGLTEGERVLIRSRHGACELPVRITHELREGELFATFHGPEAEVNRVIGPAVDPVTHTPAYKVTAVRIERSHGGAARSDHPPGQLPDAGSPGAGCSRTTPSQGRAPPCPGSS